MIVLLATAFLSLGLINLDFGRNWWKGQRLRLAIGVPLTLIYCYAAMPPLVFPQAFTLLLLTFVPNTVFSTMVSARSFIVGRRIVSMRKVSIVPYLVGLAVLGGFAAILTIAPVVDASGLRDVPDVEFAHDAPPSADLRHVRVVPVESAIFAGEKVVGQLGAYYRVGDYNIQVDGGRLVWVAPLEFQGIIQWLVRRTSPGVIVVSAENPDAGAELRQRTSMRYIPSALLNDNLYRHVYFRYGAEQILETTLQLDDHGDPQYLCTLGRPTIGWTGQKVTGVVIVDPATGAMRRIDRRNFDRLPSWVSRVYPSDLALAYNEWFGLYVHGWWNSLLARRDVHIPARGEVFGMLAGPHQFVWFVDHSSPSSTDQSMTGFTYMDTVTGKITYYTSSGGEFSSIGSENAVASNPIVRQGRLQPTQPILYRVDGTNAWVVPLVADTGKFQTLALVDAKDGHVVVGNPTVPGPQADAFAQYTAFVHGTTGPSPATAALQRGTIDRIAAGAGAVVYFTLRGGRTIYSASGVTALLARPGDHVELEVRASAGGVTGSLEVARFVDRTLQR
ncbi:MAG: hypothetical protein ACREM6_14655 [Vulcanimicrobiaceae bacterium]